MAEISLTVSSDEALVFFEWLASLQDRIHAPQLWDDAEQSVLWNLESQLEPLLTAIVLPDYREQLATAKLNIMRDG